VGRQAHGASRGVDAGFAGCWILDEVSKENVALVRGLFDAASGMDKQALLATLPEVIPRVCDPDIEWIEPSRVDGRVYRGHEGVRQSWERWLEQWQDYELEAERIVDFGDEVFVVFTERARGRTSGATVTMRNFMVLTFLEGRIVRYREFYDEAAALAAAGRTETE
jgi:ketosteroid isomerase-like protein